MHYLTELMLVPNELDGYDVYDADLDIVTMGENFDSAIEMGCDAVKEVLLSLLREGEAVPEPLSRDFNEDIPAGQRVYVYIDFDSDEPEQEFMAVSHAAELLDVSASRVYGLCREGVLRSKKVGRTLLVSVADVRDRVNRPRRAGRPAREKLEA